MTLPGNEPPLLEVENLTVRYGRSPKPAACGVSLRLHEGECLGLVGGSGCGKSTVAKAIIGLEKPESGSIRFCGRDIAAATASERREMLRQMQMVFQDSSGALDPRMRIGEAIAEALILHRKAQFPTRTARKQRVAQLLEEVELDPSLAANYPHEISGGQRQRAAIARALACKPRILLADEPLSALDVAVQAQLLRTLSRLLAKTGMAMLFVSHDLSVVRSLCSSVVVMENGRVAESGPVRQIYDSPKAEFTKTLLAAVPRLRTQAQCQSAPLT